MMLAVLPFLESIGMTVLTVAAVIVLFGGTVLIHELGHFLTAKWFGLRIDAFSIGMGPAIWKKTVDGVVYKISLLPIGGYVALPQMDITGSAFEHSDATAGILEPVTPWKRIVIAAAGPFMNLLGALVIACVIWAAGIQPREGFQEPVLGWVAENSAGYEAGLREGDRIRMVNEDRANFWMDVQVASMLNDTLDLQIIRDGQVEYIRDLPTTSFEVGGRTVRILDGVYPEMPSEAGIFIQNFQEGSPAFEAGLQPGDLIVSINGEEVTSTDDLRETVQRVGSEPMEFGFLRNDEPQQVPVQAEFVEGEGGAEGRWLVGILMRQRYENVHPDPLRQINYFKGQIVRTLVAFTRRGEARQAGESIGSVVLIFKGMHSEISDSLMNGLWFTALINVNLAILNLLPLIILDGGHIMIALYEIISGRRPHKGLITGLANVMVVLLISLMVFLAFRDALFLRRLNQDLEAPVEQKDE